MKWIGRSLVERAAATTFTRPAETLCVAEHEIAAQLSAVIEQQKLTCERKNSSGFSYCRRCSVDL
jgi:hypothetical protein